MRSGAVRRQRSPTSASRGADTWRTDRDGPSAAGCIPTGRSTRSAPNASTAARVGASSGGPAAADASRMRRLNSTSESAARSRIARPASTARRSRRSRATPESRQRQGPPGVRRGRTAPLSRSQARSTCSERPVRRETAPKAWVVSPPGGPRWRQFLERVGLSHATGRRKGAAQPRPGEARPSHFRLAGHSRMRLRVGTGPGVPQGRRSRGGEHVRRASQSPEGTSRSPSPGPPPA